jgi:murein L,D-transpeptidase YafK
MRKTRLFLFLIVVLVSAVLWKQGGLEPLWQRLFPASEPVNIPFVPVFKSKPKSKPVIEVKRNTLPKKLLNENRSLSGLLKKDLDKKNVKLHISKSEYKLTVIYRQKKIKEYPIVLGGDPVNDKLREGDKRTPEGTFKIKTLYPHRAWSKFIWIDYPTSASWQKHQQAKRAGKIKLNDRIGGEVGIHGVPDGRDSLIDDRINWTLGCISLKQKDINEIFSVVQVGTAIEISH